MNPLNHTHVVECVYPQWEGEYIQPSILHQNTQNHSYMSETFTFQRMRRHTSHGVTDDTHWIYHLPGCSLVSDAGLPSSALVFLAATDVWRLLLDNHPLGFQPGSWTIQPHTPKPCFPTTKTEAPLIQTFIRQIRLSGSQSAGTALTACSLIRPGSSV